MKKINFNSEDGIQMSGLLYEGENKTDNIIIAVHGMTSNCFKTRDDVISKYANENNIDYFCFNNRGSDLAKYIRKKINGKTINAIGGMSYEDVRECHFDIIGAIKEVKKLGYKNIYLQGHSLGSTKVIYTYQKLEDKGDIKGLILLSLVDIPTVFKYYLKDKDEDYVQLAENKVKEGKGMELMPIDSFIHPISAKGFLQYAKDYEDLDFINIAKDNKLSVLNSIKIPIFMRWGNVQELILQEASEYVNIIRKIIVNKNADIDYIDGADHGYHGKEDILASQIINFIKTNLTKKD